MKHSRCKTVPSAGLTGAGASLARALTARWGIAPVAAQTLGETLEGLLPAEVRCGAMLRRQLAERWGIDPATGERLGRSLAALLPAAPVLG